MSEDKPLEPTGISHGRPKPPLNPECAMRGHDFGVIAGVANDGAPTHVICSRCGRKWHVEREIIAALDQGDTSRPQQAADGAHADGTNRSEAE